MPLECILRIVDRVVVVTVPSATERQDRIAGLLENAGLPFQFHMGADYRNETSEQLENAGIYSGEPRRIRGQPEMTPAEVGCAVTHREVAKEIVGGADQRVLILEDDVCIQSAHVDSLESSVRAVPRKWNLAYFGYAPMNLAMPFPIRLKLYSFYPIAFLMGSERHDPRTIARIYRRGVGRYWKKAGWFNNAHAYAIDRNAASFIVQAQKVINYEADVVLNHLVRFSQLNAICLTNPIFEQSPDVPSLIGNRPSWKT